jgi:hypothetical protein
MLAHPLVSVSSVVAAALSTDGWGGCPAPRRAVSQGEGGRVGSAAPMRVRAGVGPARSLLSLCRRRAFA